MHTAKVIGLRGNSPWSLLIKKISPKYQHIATIIDDTFVYHSTLSKGVDISELKWRNIDFDIIITYELNEDEYQELLEEIRTKKDLKYSIFECVRVILKDIGVILIHDSIKPNCVELATEWQVRLNKIPFKELYEIKTPDEYAEMIMLYR